MAFLWLFDIHHLLTFWNRFFWGAVASSAGSSKTVPPSSSVCELPSQPGSDVMVKGAWQVKAKRFGIIREPVTISRD